MNLRVVIEALSVPVSARVEQRVPKKLFIENGAPTAADKRLLTDAVQEIQWVAALKPTTIGVPEYRDPVREYLEIAVLSITLRGVIKIAGKSRLAELVHRAVPYPLLLLMVDSQTLMLSVAHKRWAQNEAGKVVLDDAVTSVSLLAEESGLVTNQNFADTAEIGAAFIESMAVSRQPQTNLQELYQGWIDRLLTLTAARLTGSYRIPLSREQAVARRQALLDCERLKAEVSRLQLQAAKEKQLSRQVELNLTIQRIRTELFAAQKQL